MTDKFKDIGSLDLLTGSMPFEVKQLTDAEGREQEGDCLIEGWANKAVKDRVGDVILPSAFKEAIENYLKNPILLYMHDRRAPIGAVTDIQIKNDGLYVKAFISQASKFARDEVIPMVKAKLLNAFSVGIRPRDGKYDKATDTFVITKAELMELSVVTIPANQESVFSVKKEFDENDAFATMRSEWKAKELEVQNSNTETTINKENEIMDEMIKQLMEEIKSLKAATTDSAITAELKAKALELEGIKADMAAKEKAAAEAVKTAELEATKKELADAVASLKAFEDKITALKVDVDEAKALSVKGEGRIEFTSHAPSEVMKDYGEALSDLFIFQSITKKDFNALGSSFDVLPEKVKSVVYNPAGNDKSFLTAISKRIMEDIRANATVASLIPTIDLPTDTYKLPYDSSSITAEFLGAGTAPASTNALTIEPITMTAKKMMSQVIYNYEDEEDALLPVIPQIRKNLVNAMADLLDDTILNGTGAGSTWKGILPFLVGGTSDALRVVAASKSDLASADVQKARILMGKYGFKNTDTVMLTNFMKYGQLVDDTNVITMDKFGANATILNGELAKVLGQPIVVSDLAGDASDAVSTNPTTSNTRSDLKVAAAVVYLPAWLLGWRNMLTIEPGKDIQLQKKFIVMSLRADFKPIFPLDGNGDLTKNVGCIIVNPGS